MKSKLFLKEPTTHLGRKLVEKRVGSNNQLNSDQVISCWNCIKTASDFHENELIKNLREENRQLRELVNELTQENRALTWIIEKRRLDLPHHSQ